MVFVFSIFLPRRLILSFRKLFLFMRSRMFGFPPTTPLTDGRPYTPLRPARARIIRLTRWFIHCQAGRVGIGRYTRALGIKPAISTVPFDFLIYARPQKTSSEIYYCGRDPPPPHRHTADPPSYIYVHTRPPPPLRSSSLLCTVCSDRLSTSPLFEHPLHHLHALDNRGGLKLYESFGVFNRIRIIYNNII